MTREQKIDEYKRMDNEQLVFMLRYEGARTASDDFDIMAEAVENANLIREEILRRMK